MAQAPEMTASSLVPLLELLDAAEIEHWLDGGWGVDALLKKQTRPHKDVDLVLRVADVPRLAEVLVQPGVSFPTIRRSQRLNISPAWRIPKW